MSIFKKTGFLFAFILPFLVVWGHEMGGAWHWSAFVFAYILVPIIDAVIGKDKQNVPEEMAIVIEKQWYFQAVLYSLVWLEVALLFWASYVLATAQLSWGAGLGLTLSFMTLASNTINIAHELGHKPNAFAKWHSHLALLTTCYMHFFIEHNKGHHVHVATPLDPATSHKGQSFYQFWVQSVFGSWKSAWELEKRRLQRLNTRMSSWKNSMIWYATLPLLFACLLTFAGYLWAHEWIWQIPVFFFAQSFLGFSSLEAVNYIEHYGMRRKAIAPNRYERVNPLHSWNSSFLVSNLLLFQLQRHSDHHAHAARPYQILRHFEESPQLPAGYPVMIILALMPPLWFKVMDQRLEQWQASQSIHV